jgi:hypothetical protein
MSKHYGAAVSNASRKLKRADQVLVPKERVISRGQGCWNCITGDSLILTPIGGVRLSEASDITQLFSQDGWQKTDAWRASGEQDIVEVVTTFGSRLRMTPDHRVFTDRGWVAARDLRPSVGTGRLNNYQAGDEVTTMPEVVLSYIDLVDQREAELLGAITGDGWVNPKNGVGFGFSADRLDAWRDLLAYAGTRFESREQPHLIGTNGNIDNFYTLQWRTQAAKTWANGIDKKHIPRHIWRSTPSVIGAYLRGLFTTDGSISDKTVSFYQVTKTLIDEVQMILRTIGIQSHLRVELRERPHQDLYQLSIGRVESLKRFAELVNFKDQRRRDKLTSFLSIKSQGSPERIRSITPVGRAEVYDVSVPATESFFANGMLVHNCKHWDREAAKPLWEGKRQHELKTALDIVLDLPDGEPKTVDECKTPQALRAFNIKAMVNSLDHLVASGHVGCCKGGGRTADGNQVGDFVVHSFLCDRWSGVVGASLAREGTTDKLPEELAEDMKKLTEQN